MEKRNLGILLLLSLGLISIGYIALQTVNRILEEIAVTFERNNLAEDHEPYDIEEFVNKIKKIFDLYKKLNNSKICKIMFANNKYCSYFIRNEQNTLGQNVINDENNEQSSKDKDERGVTKVLKRTSPNGKYDELDTYDYMYDDIRDVRDSTKNPLQRKEKEFIPFFHNGQINSWESNILITDKIGYVDENTESIDQMGTDEGIFEFTDEYLEDESIADIEESDEIIDDPNMAAEDDIEENNLLIIPNHTSEHYSKSSINAITDKTTNSKQTSSDLFNITTLTNDRGKCNSSSPDLYLIECSEISIAETQTDNILESSYYTNIKNHQVQYQKTSSLKLEEYNYYTRNDLSQTSEHPRENSTNKTDITSLTEDRTSEMYSVGEDNGTVLYTTSENKGKLLTESVTFQGSSSGMYSEFKSYPITDRDSGFGKNTGSYHDKRTRTNSLSTSITDSNNVIESNYGMYTNSNNMAETDLETSSNSGFGLNTNSDRDEGTVTDLPKQSNSVIDMITLRDSDSGMYTNTNNYLTAATHSITDQDIETTTANEEMTWSPTSDTSSGMQTVTDQLFSGATTFSEMNCMALAKVTQYDMFLSYNTTLLWGDIGLTINAPCDSDQIILHFEGVSVNLSSPNLIQVQSVGKHPLTNITSMNYNKHRKRIVIELGSKIKPGINYLIRLKFVSQLNKLERGATLTMYLTRSVGNEPVQRSWIIGTFLYPNFGKLVFPCIEAPGHRSIFHLRILREPKDKVVFNALTKTTKTMRKKSLLEDFYYTPEIPLSSFTLNILPNYSSFVVERTPPLAFLFPPYLKYSVDRIVKIANKILDFFIEYFQYNLPVQQISVVVSENLYSEPPAPYATIFVSSKYLFEKYESDYELKENIYYLLAKQFCDLWIGNIVSFNSWNDNWIKEGFSIFMANLAMTHVFEDYDYSTFIMRIQHNAFYYHRFPVFDEQRLHKDELYRSSKVDSNPSKGAILLHMVYNILKPQPFQEAIRIFFKNWYNYCSRLYNYGYLREGAQQSVHPDVFWNSFNIIQENLDIKEFINSWAFSYYPTLHVDLKDGTAIVKQVLHSDPDYNYSSWWIPLNYMTGNDIHFDYSITHWMKQQQSIRINFPFNETWIVFNPHYSGFVRFNYSTNIWKMIITELRKGTTKIPSSIKAQLLDDAFTLASQNLLDYSIPMTMALYLKDEEEYAPWFVALKHFSYLAEVLIHYPEWQMYQVYMARILHHVDVNLQNNTANKNEKEIQGKLRKIGMTWSCLNDLPNGCKKWVLQEFQKWEDDPSYLSKNIMLAELKSVIYCMGAKSYDETSRYLYGLSKSHTTTTIESLRLLRGVACTSKFTTFMEILTELFDTNNPEFSLLRLKEFVLSLKQSDVNSLLCFRYLKSNWKTIYERFHESNSILNAIIKGATYFLRTKAHYNEVLTLRKSVPESDTATLASLDIVIDQIVYNINWDKRNLNNFRKLLRFYNKNLI